MYNHANYYVSALSINIYTVKPVKKGHRKDRQHMVFKDEWSFFGGYIVLYYQGRIISKCGLYLQGSLYLEVTFKHMFDCNKYQI